MQFTEKDFQVFDDACWKKSKGGMFPTTGEREGVLTKTFPQFTDEQRAAFKEQFAAWLNNQ